MSLISEAFIYIYMGFAFWDQTTYYNQKTEDIYVVEISWALTACLVGTVIIARCLSIYIVYWILIA